jgi:NAD(P) transhydrogenase
MLGAARLAGRFRPATTLPRFAAPARQLNGVSIGAVKETNEGEKRVVITPANVTKLKKKGAEVFVEKGAGAQAGFSDALYEAAGATMVDAKTAWSKDLTLKLNCPTKEEAAMIGDRMHLSLTGARLPEGAAIVDQLANQGATAFDLSMLLRTLSRGQSFDVISSQANIAGYRAVIDASYNLQRPYAGQMTAAGKIQPTKVMVVGAGVAGLAAIQQAKNMNAIVTAFDVRAAAAEQVESMGATFLKVESDEDGSAAGGYAKEMSAEWFEAARKMLLEEVKTTNVIITTALIPGKKAPVLITKEMVENMPPGSVTVDLASEAGGNVETTVPGEVVQVNNCTCVGYTNYPSRMASTASTLFGNNVTNFILSMEKDGALVIDTEKDQAVRSMCVVEKGKKLEPYVPPPTPPPTAAEMAAAAPPPPPDPQKEALNSAGTAAAVVVPSLFLGSAVPSAGMLSTFALSIWLGSQSVQGVAHALHSPLMSITNAISGMTVVGGMLQLGGGIFPHSGAQLLATTAVGLSSVNLVGGFMVTEKMLDMFRRPDDPPEYWHYFLLPSGAAAATYCAGAAMGNGAGFAGALALYSGLGCIAGIGSMSSQTTTRMAPFLAMGGVGSGILAALGCMNVDASVYMQLAGASAAGGAAGYYVAGQIGPTELPQAVAAFHSLVGIAATSTAVGDYLVHDMSHMDAFHSGSIYMGAWMGSITATGSVIAALKLAEKMDSKPLMLPGRDVMNMAMGGGSALGLFSFMTTSSAGTASTSLAAGTFLSGALGLHMTASIGGADMPVVITLLNSYSGWALCAEGFILDQPVLTIVGALIGSSGAFLTKIMCDGMNRSLANVILGGFGTEAGAVQTQEGLVHKEIDTDGVCEVMTDAEKICIVPGYGLAVAQAQHTVASIANILKNKGKDVKFAVHPVAGRMPGQLNVLLAEAGVPYDIVVEMEEMNDEMNEVDVSLIVGANDTVNSAALEDPNSGIAGMPVIEVWRGRQVVFCKRSMASGYAGVDNPVFYKPNTDMFLGNASQTMADLLTKIKAQYKVD